jgi:hypothetical protein
MGESGIERFGPALLVFGLSDDPQRVAVDRVG